MRLIRPNILHNFDFILFNTHSLSPMGHFKQKVLPFSNIWYPLHVAYCYKIPMHTGQLKMDLLREPECISMSILQYINLDRYTSKEHESILLVLCPCLFHVGTICKYQYTPQIMLDAFIPSWISK